MKFKIKEITFVAIFATLSVLFYIIIPKIKLPIFPEFLEINFSMIPIIICAFMLGPIDGTLCVLIRFLVKLPFSSTMCVGEAADFIIGLAVALVIGLIYCKTNYKRKELIAFLSGVVVWILMGVITNIFINIPFYSWMLKDVGGIDAIISVCSTAFNVITGGQVNIDGYNSFMFYYVFLAVIPFNAILSIIVMLIAWPINKRLKVLYDKIDF